MKECDGGWRGAGLIQQSGQDLASWKTALKRTPVNIVVYYGPRQNMGSGTCSSLMDLKLCDVRGDLWTMRL